MYNVYIRIAKDRREVEKLKRMHSELFFLFLCRIVSQHISGANINYMASYKT